MKKIYFGIGIVLLLIVGVFAAHSERIVMENLDGSDASGTASIRMGETKNIANIDVKLRLNDMEIEPGEIFEGWLVDEETGYKLSLGSFLPLNSGKALFSFKQDIVNPSIYDMVVVTREPLNDINPNPGEGVLSAEIPGSFNNTLLLNAKLDGRNEVPKVSTQAEGEGDFVLDIENNTLSFDVVYSGLTTNETGAHIHGFAQEGVNAGVLFALPAGTHKIGVWNYSEDQEAMIIAGLTYVNVHSVEYPNGEIRGQILV